MDIYDSFFNNTNFEYINKARKILEEDNETSYSEEEHQIKLIIVSLCIRYGFTWKFVGDHVFVYLIIDEWCFSYMKNSIPLKHRNKLHTPSQFHFQKKFTNVIYILQYIKKHDNFCYKPRPFKKKIR